jgi:NAD(P)-dependent dehydrogenase (short-subunit alcohol dehydrogenase family)
MALMPPVVLILGAGPNIGQAIAHTFASNGYKVALAARSLKEIDSTEDQLNIQSDFSKTDDVVDTFTKVKNTLGIPSVVVYNGNPPAELLWIYWYILASAANFTPADDPFALSLEDLKADTTVNIYSAFIAAQQAVSGFSQLPDSAARTFIYTGNILNVTVLPKFVSAGIGKSGAAHLVWASSEAYKNRGYKWVSV